MSPISSRTNGTAGRRREDHRGRALPRARRGRSAAREVAGWRVARARPGRPRRRSPRRRPGSRRTGPGAESPGREPQIVPSPAGLRRAVEPEKQEREPLVAQHLDVAELAESEVRKGVEDRRHRGRPGMAGEMPHSQNMANPVSGNVASQTRLWARSARAPREARRCHQGQQPHEMLCVGERPAVRVKHVGVEEPERCGRQRVDVPREDPGRQEGVTGVDATEPRWAAAGHVRTTASAAEKQEDERALASATPGAWRGVPWSGWATGDPPGASPGCQPRAWYSRRQRRRRASTWRMPSARTIPVRPRTRRATIMSAALRLPSEAMIR